MIVEGIVCAEAQARLLDLVRRSRCQAGLTQTRRLQ